MHVPQIVQVKELYQLRPCLEVHRRIKSYYGIISPNDSERFDNEETPC